MFSLLKEGSLEASSYLLKLYNIIGHPRTRILEKANRTALTNSATVPDSEGKEREM